MIDFDTSRKPARHSEWAQLVRAIEEASPGDEAVWLECKSAYDWSSSLHIAKLARAILAMANRMPEDAAPFMSGSGLVIVGLEPGSPAGGVDALDPTDLENKLATYIGQTDGPRWNPLWVTLDSKNVLIVEVDAPRAGDPPYLLQSSSNDLKMGQVFVRNKSKSAPASQLDMKRLVGRSAPASEEPELAITLSVTPSTGLRKYFWTDKQIDDLIDAERRELMKTLTDDQAKPKPFTDAVNISNVGMSARQRTIGTYFAGSDPDKRTAEQFTREVENYLNSLRTSAPDQLLAIATAMFLPLVFTVSNKTAKNYSEVQLDIRIAGMASAADDPGPNAAQRLNFSGRPRKFGPTSRASVLAGFPDVGLPHRIFEPGTYSAGLPTRRRTITGGSFDHSLEEFSLRPFESDLVVEDELVVLIPRDRTDEVMIEWQATASNVDARASGTLKLEYDGEPLDVFAAAMKRPTR